MSKNKNSDINLFKAASKEDTKIQTGVSKSFIFVIVGLVAFIAAGAYVGMLYMEVSALKADLDRYQGYQIYSTSVNQITNKISEDMDYLNAIQRDIDAGIAIKDYSMDTSKLYPGLSDLQKALITSNRYTYLGTEYQGCVPDSVIIDSELNIGIEYSYTDGMTAYEIMQENETTGVLEPASIVFDKGYIVFRFQSPDDTAANNYINNIVNLAPTVFAIEEGVSNIENIDSLSFESGIVSVPNDENPNYVLYVKAKLKSALQIILEDEWLETHLVSSSSNIGISSINYNGTSIIMEIASSVPIYTVCSYFDSTNLFEEVDFNQGNIKFIEQQEVHTGTLTFVIKENK